LIVWILAFLSTLPISEADRDEPEWQRQARLSLVAQAVDQAAVRHAGGEVRRSELACALLAVGWRESHWSAYVGQARCEQGTWNCDVDRRTGLPRARTYWQLWPAACRPLESVPPGSDAAVIVGAACAARYLAAGRRACGSWQGAFGYYAGRGCEWPGGERRARLMQRIVAAM